MKSGRPISRPLPNAGPIKSPGARSSLQREAPSGNRPAPDLLAPEYGAAGKTQRSGPISNGNS
ncbi:hypothetical protein [Rhodoblastus sp.]|jgi:hypothetical protein|uniref:hypothetical protein n=1 Tax=Rhodoblastus sp. TaxID=1962975 RepID=UPI0025D1E6AB|nr:hypothetical protein [Rhodoblastus sp.]